MQVERDVVMQVGRRRDGDGVDAAVEQRIEIAERRAAERASHEIALLAIGVGYSDQADVGHFRQDARMVAAHDADAHHPDLQRTVRANSRLTHDPKGSLSDRPALP